MEAKGEERSKGHTPRLRVHVGHQWILPARRRHRSKPLSPMAPLAPADEFDRPALLWDPLSDVSWPRTEEVNWQREIVLELRRITAHLKYL